MKLKEIENYLCARYGNLDLIETLHAPRGLESSNSTYVRKIYLNIADDVLYIMAYKEIDGEISSYSLFKMDLLEHDLG